MLSPYAANSPKVKTRRNKRGLRFILHLGNKNRNPNCGFKTIKIVKEFLKYPYTLL